MFQFCGIMCHHFRAKLYQCNRILKDIFYQNLCLIVSTELTCLKPIKFKTMYFIKTFVCNTCTEPNGLSQLNLGMLGWVGFTMTTNLPVPVWHCQTSRNPIFIYYSIFLFIFEYEDSHIISAFYLPLRSGGLVQFYKYAIAFAELCELVFIYVFLWVC